MGFDLKNNNIHSARSRTRPRPSRSSQVSTGLRGLSHMEERRRELVVVVGERRVAACSSTAAEQAVDVVSVRSGRSGSGSEVLDRERQSNAPTKNAEVVPVVK